MTTSSDTLPNYDVFAGSPPSPADGDSMLTILVVGVVVLYFLIGLFAAYREISRELKSEQDKQNNSVAGEVIKKFAIIFVFLWCLFFWPLMIGFFERILHGKKED